MKTKAPFVLFASLHTSKQFFSYVRMSLVGRTSTKQGLICLAQGHNTVTPVRLEPTTHWSPVKHSTTESLRSQLKHEKLPSMQRVNLHAKSLMITTCLQFV